MEYEGGREPEGEELTSDKSEEVEEKPSIAAAVAAQDLRCRRRSFLPVERRGVEPRRAKVCRLLGFQTMNAQARPAQLNIC
jgi:hypothetical protein